MRKSVTGIRPYMILFGLALIVRLLAALPQQQPSYMDEAYSYVNALNLAEGRGFVEDFVWNYLDDPEPPPRPSHLYWMPLTSIMAWLGMVAGGTTYGAAQAPFVVVSALLAPLSYWAADLIAGRRWYSWLAGLLAIFSGFYFPFWTAIDNFTPFAVAGSLALLLAYEGMTAKRGERRIPKGHSVANGEWWRSGAFRVAYVAGAGACVGLAHLARADGPLLLAAIWLVYVLQWRTGGDVEHAPGNTRATPGSRPELSLFIRRLLSFTLVLLLGYLLVMAPWFFRNWQAAGMALPVAGSQTIWLPTATNLFTSYNNLYSYGRELSARTFFSQGLGPVAQGRWWALTANFQHVLAEWGMIFLAPLAVIGAWQRRRHLLVRLAGLYAGLLFLVMSLVFAFPGALGGIFHSGAALLPFVYATALAGLDGVVVWAAARRRGWDAQLARLFFGAGLLLMAVLLTSFVYYQKALKNDAWNSGDSLQPAIVDWVGGQDPAATVMINSPPAYRYYGGGLSVVIPNEDIETTLAAARRYGVDYIVLESNHPASLRPLYTTTFTHPGLSLVKSFGQGRGAVYIYEVIRP